MSKLINIDLQAICVSFIYKRDELLTLYIQDIKANYESNQQESTIKFNVGYLQIDNQFHEPTSAVLIRPRDLYYEYGTISFRITEDE